MPRIIVQYRVIVGENLMLFHQPRSHYDQFFPPNSIDHAAMMKQYRNEVGLAAFAWLDARNGLSFQHMDLTHGRKLSCHHMNSIAGRTIDMSTCPSTTCTQTWGGRSTYHHMNSITGRSICVQGVSQKWPTLHHLSRWNVCNPGQRHPTMQTPPNLPRSLTASRLPLRRQSRERNTCKSGLHPKHANYINYAWLYYP